MKEMLEKMKGKKGKDMDQGEVDAKMNVLEKLRDQMSDMMADKMKGGHEEMQKVAVMAKDKEGLEAGLDKAKSILEQSEEMEPSEDEYEEEMTPEEIDEQIAKLQEMKAKLQSEEA